MAPTDADAALLGVAGQHKRQKTHEQRGGNAGSSSGGEGGNNGKNGLVDYLCAHENEQLMEILREEDPLRPYAVTLEFLRVCDAAPMLARRIASSPAVLLPALHAAAVEAQEVLLQREEERLRGNHGNGDTSALATAADALDALEVKLRVTVRVRMFGGFASHSPRIGALRVEHVGRLVCLGGGTVIRAGQRRIMESREFFHCTSCRRRTLAFADHGNGGLIEQPACCAYCGCERLRRQGEQILQDYQEVSVQESLQQLDAGKMPHAVTVVLTADLAGCCATGDDICISGEVVYRWRQFKPGARCDVEMIVVANHVHVYDNKESAHELTPALVSRFERFWERHAADPLRGRDLILSGICPQLYGMYLVKLSMMLMLVGGVPYEEQVSSPEHRMSGSTSAFASARGGEGNEELENAWIGREGASPRIRGTRVRGDVHLLIVGDPGTGKSQFLKFAARVSHRSVLTSGMGTTAAGLTCAAIKDGGEWSLEAGALVLADGGVCCIDEFSTIRASDRATIHEAMEQQTISVAKAGMVARLFTRTSVFGVMNPKGLYDHTQSVAENCALSDPLMSRFDIILVLLDTKDPEWDQVVSTHILNGCVEDGYDVSKGEPRSRRRRHRAYSPGGAGGGGDPNEGVLATTTGRPSDEHWQLDESDDGPRDLDRIFSDIDVMRCYIQYVRNKFRPKLTESAERVLSTYFQNQRAKADRTASRTTVRLFESLIRLAQAHARLMARDVALLVDAVFAILIAESSMHTSPLLDINCIHSQFAEDPDGNYIELEERVLQMLGMDMA